MTCTGISSVRPSTRSKGERQPWLTLAPVEREVGVESGSSQEDSAGAQEEETAANEVPPPPVQRYERPRQRARPDAPTAQQRAEHNVNHLPYRAWCTWCVQGKAPNCAHRRVNRSEEAVDLSIPRVSMDYMFISNTATDKMTPILVVKDWRNKAIFAHAVPRKGGGDKWIVKRLVEDLDGLGYGGMKISIRSDQEVGIVDLKNQVRRERWKEFQAIIEEVASQRKDETVVVKADMGPVTVMEESAVSESSSNGMVENAIRHVRGHFRTTKAYLEDMLREESRSPIRSGRG